MNRVQKVFALLLASGLAAFAQQYTISTVAGIGGVQGFVGDEGPATSGELDKPFRVAVGSSGNFYIADYYTYVIRMVTASTGNINTIAGDGVPGYAGDNGPATSASIADVHGIAVDSSGNVYIADTSNSRVRKIDTSGNIATFAGNGTRGYAGDGAAATGAELWFPAGLAFDSSGNLYIADYGSSTVRKVDTKGNISIVAGTGSFGDSGDGGSAAKAALGYPYSIAFDQSGNLFIADTSNNNIRKVDTSGNISTYISNIMPENIAIDATGAIYFVDGVTSYVQEILPGGTIIPIAGNGSPFFAGDGGPALQAELGQPQGVAATSSGNVYVADTQNEAIRLLTPVPFSVGAITNAASSLSGPIAPGEIVTIYGAGLGPSTLTQYKPDSNGYIPTTLAGVQVTFNNAPAPLIYVSATQIAAIVPYSMHNAGTAQVSVNYNGGTSVVMPVPVVDTAPGIFTANTTGSGQAAAVNADGTLNSTAHPAKIGNDISLFVTGEGQTTPEGVDGKPAPLNPPYPKPNAGVSVMIGGQPALVSYYGGAPGEVAGLMQVNVQIPQSIQTGDAVPVSVLVGGAPSQTTVTIAVSQ
ncbi:MAG TPA: IPT/TIG domain-containing protein [Bryobacteraceae bacterium]|nr:IPT/TIG domain-containing protein [Bryobacteraceae bacterium]